jgi:predicted nucleic acid-binding protein
MLAVLDTNILVDFLNGITQARTEIQRHREVGVSVISWVEVLVGARSIGEETVIRDFLAGFRVLDVDQDTAEEAIRVRRSHRVKLPDAIIWASARARGALLVTRNTKDFPRDDPGVRIPYSLTRGRDV